MNWNVRLGDGSIRDVIYWPELKSMDEFAKVRGGNPILFPFPGRTFDQGAIYSWKAADGLRRPMPIHGIARQSSFRITRMDKRGFAALLVPGDEAKASSILTTTNLRSPTALSPGSRLRIHPEKSGQASHPMERRASFLFHASLERRLLAQ